MENCRLALTANDYAEGGPWIRTIPLLQSLSIRTHHPAVAVSFSFSRSCSRFALTVTSGILKKTLGKLAAAGQGGGAQGSQSGEGAGGKGGSFSRMCSKW